MSADVIASMAAVAAIVGSAAIAGVRYFLRQEIRPLLTWMQSHEDRHEAERVEMAMALARQGLQPPDGWPKDKAVEVPERGERE